MFSIEDILQQDFFFFEWFHLYKKICSNSFKLSSNKVFKMTKKTRRVIQSSDF